MTNKSNHKPLVAPPSNTPRSNLSRPAQFQPDHGLPAPAAGPRHDRPEQRHHLSHLHQLSQLRPGRPLAQPDPQLIYELRFGPAVAAFLLISAVAHFSLATFGYKWYVRNLKKGMNPVRFYEYALSSS